MGKTTTAVNLAACLAERGQKVLLIDLDPQANATSGLGVAQERGASIYANLLGDSTPLASRIRETAMRNLDIIPSEIDLAGAEVDMARRERYLHCLKDVMAPFLAESRYRFVVLDCPPSLGILTTNALAAAHSLIIPSQCEYLALEGLSVIARLVKQLRQSGANPELEIEGIVMTMFDARTNLGAQVVEEVRTHFGDKVYNAVIPRSIRLSEAPSFGKPIILYDRHSTGAKAYRALAREFLARRKAEAGRAAAAGRAPAAAPHIAANAPITRRERLRRCYFHEELDRPGVFVRTGFPHDDPSYDRLKQYLAERTELKRPWGISRLAPPYPVEERTEPVSEDFERRVGALHTPKGDLRSSRLVSLKGQPGLHETYFINTREDAEKYLSLPMPEIGGEVESFFDLDRQTGDCGIADIALGINPAGVTAELLGSENFAVFSLAERDLLHALCEHRMNVMIGCVKFLLERKAGPFFSMAGEEYIVPPLHGPADFRDFNVKYDKPILDLIHEAGGRVHIHCHGRIKAVFQDFVDMGTDVLHPFEPPPMGDITTAEAKAMARNRMCLEGNIQIADLYERTPAHVREATQALIAEAFDDRKGLIVCPSASPYIRGAGETCFDAFKAMIDAAIGPP